MSASIAKNDRRDKWIAFLQEMESDVDPKIIRLMDSMRQVSHALYQLGESSLGSAGLTFARFRLLMGLLISSQLDGIDELNPSEISVRLGISRNTVSTLIRELEHDGLIERHLDNNDRRRFNIRLTSTGQNLVYKNASQHYHVIAGCFDTLTDEEQESLSSILSKLDESIGAKRKEHSLNQNNS